MSNVFLATPLYDGRIHFSACCALTLHGSRQHNVRLFSFQGSLLPYNCTKAWAQALDARDAGEDYKWFAMLHDDIEPDERWLDTLIALAEEHGADFMSAVAPVKNSTGDTSTAIQLPGRFKTVTLTVSQVNHADFPVTFGASEAIAALARLPEPLRVADVPPGPLLANTGCMVCRIDRPWCDAVWFDNRCEVVRVSGKRDVVGISEDWFFTKAIAEHGGRVMATRAVSLKHHGRGFFASKDVWGQPRHVT
jgi:hypothetical protein